MTPRQRRIAAALPVGLALVLLSACAQDACLDADCTTTATPSSIEGNQVPVSASDTTDSDIVPKEDVQYATYDGTQLTFGVLSTGCTAAGHFRVEHATQDGVCEVTLVRDRPDLCRRAPFVAELSLNWERPADCSTQRLLITNPVVDLKAQLESVTADTAITRKPLGKE